MADQRQRQRARQAFADHVGHRLVVEQAMAEIAARDDAGDPVDVLHGHRLIQAVGDLVGLRLGVGFLEGCAALVDQLRADVVAVVARRCLDDREGHDAQHEEHGYGGCDAHKQKSEHGC